MRFIFLIFAWQTMAVALYAQGNASPFGGLTEAIETVEKEASSGVDEISLESLKRLHVALAGNRGNVWAVPEPILSRLRSEVEPIRDVVFDLASSTEGNRRFYASVFASYLEPTNATRTLLENLAYDEHASASGTAMDTLFGMGWESDALRSDVVSSLKAELDGESSVMASIARNNVGEWGVSEAAPTLMDLLEKEYEEHGKITSVATQMKLFGEAAKDQLPRLRELMLKVESDPDSHPREVEALNYAVGVISGEFGSQSPTGVQRRDAAPPDANLSSSSEKPEAISKSDVVMDDDDDPESLKWPLVLIAVAALGIFFLILRAFLRGRTS